MLLKRVVFFFCIFLVLEYIDTNLKYLKYFLFPLTIFFLSFDNKKRNNFNFKYFQYLVLFYLLLFFYSLLKQAFWGNFSFYQRFFEETYFILAPLIIILLICKRSWLSYKEIDVIPIYVLFSCTIALFVEVLQRKGFAFSISQLILGFITSDVKTESTLSFMFGLLSIYFFVNSKYLYFFFSFVLTAISFKRIALVAIILVISYILISKKVKSIEKFKVIGIIMNIIIPITLYVLTTGIYDDFLSYNFDISTDQLLQGRITFYSSIIDRYGPPGLLGEGIGFINTSNFFVLNKENLHSDLLKNLYEFGILGYLIWIYIFYFKNRDDKILPFIIYLNILFISDNVFIYFNTLFLFYILCYLTIVKNYFKSSEVN